MRTPVSVRTKSPSVISPYRERSRFVAVEMEVGDIPLDDISRFDVYATEITKTQPITPRLIVIVRVRQVKPSVVPGIMENRLKEHIRPDPSLFRHGRDNVTFRKAVFSKYINLSQRQARVPTRGVLWCVQGGQCLRVRDVAGECAGRPSSCGSVGISPPVPGTVAVQKSEAGVSMIDNIDRWSGPSSGEGWWWRRCHDAHQGSWLKANSWKRSSLLRWLLSLPTRVITSPT